MEKAGNEPEIIVDRGSLHCIVVYHSCMMSLSAYATPGFPTYQTVNSLN